MISLSELDPELSAAACFALLAGLGGFLRAGALALFGALGALVSLALFGWAQRSLVRVGYERVLEPSRVAFGERAELRLELVNDKPLPLPWLRVSELVPEGLEFLDPRAVQVSGEEGRRLLQGFALLPFQRVVRRLEVRGAERGRHVLAAGELRSGDPLGLSHRTRSCGEVVSLLVYPKIFALAPFALPARQATGEVTSRRHLPGDPSRVAGMRAYRAGDPLRHVDWRATARSGELLVRDFEVTATPRLLVFFDPPVEAGEEAVEFHLALVASLLVHLASREFPVGCFGTGLAEGLPVAQDPSLSPGALPAMLELLALWAAGGRRSLAALLAEESTRLRGNVALLVVSSRFDGPLLEAIARCRRGAAVTAVLVEEAGALAPAEATLEGLVRVERPEGWRDVATLALLG